MRYVIIGASAAAINAVKGIRALDKQGEITLISQDKQLYSRCMLHLLTTGERTVHNASFVSSEFIAENKVNWRKGVTAIGIDVKKKQIFLDNQETVIYDKVLLATGAKASIPPVKNLQNAKGVYLFRDLEDVCSIKEHIKTREKQKKNIVEKVKNLLLNNKQEKKKKKAIVLGAGLVGLDAAYALLELGVEVSIIEMAERILSAQLDQETSSMCAQTFLEHGANIYLTAQAKQAILEDGAVKGIELVDGQILPCDFVVVAAGIKANTAWIKEKSLLKDGKVVVNNNCQANLKDIYAAGDITGYGIWPIATKMGYVAGINMAGGKKTFTDDFALKNSIHFWNFTAVSLGLIEPPDNTYQVEVQKSANNFQKIIHKDGQIYGVILVGDVSYCGFWQQLIVKKIDISNLEKNLFKLGYGDFFQTNAQGQYSY